MPNTQSYTYNAWESKIQTGATADGAIPLVAGGHVGLRAPGYLVVDPDSVLLREYIYFTGIETDILTGVTRGLAGSANNNQAHDDGVTVRAVTMHQMFDDIWGAMGDGVQDLVDHIADGSDPHVAAGYLDADAGDLRYLRLSGLSAMTGTLKMDSHYVSGVADGAAAGDAVNKGQLDAVNTPLVAADLTFLKFNGSRKMTGTLQMDSHYISGVNDGGAAKDAVNKSQLDTKLNLSGGVMTGILEVQASLLLRGETGNRPTMTFVSDDAGGATDFKFGKQGSVSARRMQFNAVVGDINFYTLGGSVSFFRWNEVEQEAWFNKPLRLIDVASSTSGITPLGISAAGLIVRMA